MRTGLTLATLLVALTTALPHQAMAASPANGEKKSQKAEQIQQQLRIRILDARGKQVYVARIPAAVFPQRSFARFFPRTATNLQRAIARTETLPASNTNRGNVLQLQGFGTNSASAGGGGCNPNVASCN